MNTGAEAVETAIKVARKWGYQVKGVPAGPGHDRRRRRQLPRPHDHDRQLLHRPGRARRLRAVHARASGSCRTATSRRCAAAIDETTVAVLIEPIQGEAGRARAAGGLPARRPRAVHRARTCCSSPTRSSPASAAPATPSPATTRASCPTCTCWARRSAAASCRSRRWRADADVLGVLSPASTARRSAATRWPARSAPRSSSCCATGEYQAAAGGARRAAARRAATRWSAHGLLAVRGRGLWAGVDIDPALMTGRQACERLAGARRAGQGHPRLDAPARPAAGHRARASSTARRPTRRRPRPTLRSAGIPVSDTRNRAQLSGSRPPGSGWISGEPHRHRRRLGHHRLGLTTPPEDQVRERATWTPGKSSTTSPGPSARARSA